MKTEDEFPNELLPLLAIINNQSSRIIDAEMCTRHMLKTIERLEGIISQQKKEIEKCERTIEACDRNATQYESVISQLKDRLK
jgi:hypothetical protein